MSDILIQGGSYSGSPITGSAPPSGSQNFSYGADFESVTGGANSGSIRVMGTAFRNHSGAAVKFFDCQGCQATSIKGEQVNASSLSTLPGTGIIVDGTSASTCSNDVVLGGSFANYLFNLTVGSNCKPPLAVNNSQLNFFCTGTFSIGMGATVALFPGSTVVSCASLVNTGLVELPLSFSGNLRNLYVTAATGPGNSSGVMVSVYVGSGGSAVATALQCPLAMGVTACSDTTDVIGVPAGQTVTVRVTNPSSTQTEGALARVRVGVEFQ